MNQHKASNGVTVYLDSNGNLKFQKSHAVDIYGELEAFWVQPAREFFQAERDEELGRWRDPNNPDRVCYPLGANEVAVFSEQDCYKRIWTRDKLSVRKPSDMGTGIPAQRYFAAHPEPEPDPWDSAQPDEIWVLTINGDRSPYLRNEYGTWTNSTSNVYVGDGTITAGHRIWPEEDK